MLQTFFTLSPLPSLILSICTHIQSWAALWSTGYNFCQILNPSSFHWSISTSEIHPIVINEAGSSFILSCLENVECHIFGFSISANRIKPCCYGTDYNQWILALSFLTPFTADFVDWFPHDIPMIMVGNEKIVVGLGTVMYKFCTTAGDTVFLPGFRYHMPQVDFHLASQ